MAFQTLNFSNKMSSRISLEIKFWITFNTGPETRNFQGASAQIQLAQKGSIFPKKSLIFISKMAILGSFRGGSEVAFVTSVFFALSSVTYCTFEEGVAPYCLPTVSRRCLIGPPYLLLFDCHSHFLPSTTRVYRGSAHVVALPIYFQQKVTKSLMI